MCATSPGAALCTSWEEHQVRVIHYGCLTLNICIFSKSSIDYYSILRNLKIWEKTSVKTIFSAFTAAKMMGARLGRWDIEGDPPMGSPTNAVIGLFMLWWGWLAFNAGSTFGANYAQKNVTADSMNMPSDCSKSSYLILGQSP